MIRMVMMKARQVRNVWAKHTHRRWTRDRRMQITTNGRKSKQVGIFDVAVKESKVSTRETTDWGSELKCRRKREKKMYKEAVVVEMVMLVGRKEKIWPGWEELRGSSVVLSVWEKIRSDEGRKRGGEREVKENVDQRSMNRMECKQGTITRRAKGQRASGLLNCLLYSSHALLSIVFLLLLPLSLSLSRCPSN